MSAKEPRLFVAFPTSTQAFHLKDVAGAYGLQGKLVPIPRELSAGCGFSWAEPAANQQQLLCAIETEAIEVERVVKLNR